MYRLLVILLTSVLCLTAIGATPALAAVRVVSSQPRANATLDRMPSEARVILSEPITSESLLTVADAQGRVVDTGNSRLDPNDTSNRTLIVSLRDDLSPGRYTVNWLTVSARDLDVDQGSFSFTVEDPTAGSLSSSQQQTNVPTAAITASPVATTEQSNTAPSNETAASTVATAQQVTTATITVQPASPTALPPTPATATATAMRPPNVVVIPTITATATPTEAANLANPAPIAEAQPRELPNTAGGAPAPWALGLVAAVGAAVIWIARQRR